MNEPLEDLARIAAALKRNERKRDELLAERDELITAARASNTTWRAIAQTLGMTEHGVVKAVKTRANKEA